MKSRMLYRTFILLLFTGFIVIQLGCSGCEEEQLEPIPDEMVLKEEKYVVSGFVYDAATKDGVDGVSIKISGQDAGKITDGQGRSASSFETTDGFVSFFLKPTEENEPTPFYLVLSVIKTGYISSGMELIINQTGMTPFEIFLISKDIKTLENIDGVAIVEAVGSTDATGIVAKDIAVKASVSGDDKIAVGGSAEVTVEEGTIITDEQGQTLSGKLTLTATYHSNQSVESLRTFPGGLTTTTIDEEIGSGLGLIAEEAQALARDLPTDVLGKIPENAKPETIGNALMDIEENFQVKYQDTAETGGSSESGYFVSGGFSAVEMKDDQGKVASKFSKPVRVKISVPENTINPETKQTVKIGEKIPLWSLNTDEANKWKIEGPGDVSADENGKLYAEFDAKHLSYWNLDWHYGPKCSEGKLIIADENGKPLLKPYRIRFALSGWFQEKPYSGDGKPNVLYNVPLGREITLSALDAGEVVKSDTVTNLCGPVDKTAEQQKLERFIAMYEQAIVRTNERIAIIDEALLLLDSLASSMDTDFRKSCNSKQWWYIYNQSRLAKATVEEILCWYYWKIYYDRYWARWSLTAYTNSIAQYRNQIEMLKNLNTADYVSEFTLKIPQTTIELTDLTIAFDALCENDANRVSPISSAAVNYYKGQDWQVYQAGTTDANGELILHGLEVGTSYRIQIQSRYAEKGKGSKNGVVEKTITPIKNNPPVEFQYSVPCDGSLTGASD